MARIVDWGYFLSDHFSVLGEKGYSVGGYGGGAITNRPIHEFCLICFIIRIRVTVIELGYLMTVHIIWFVDTLT